jgi:sugar/nucleoside kinase (ribokinase family)
MKQILGIGNALVDVITPINSDSILREFGLPKGSMTLVDNTKSTYIKNKTAAFKSLLASGGSAANTIHGLAMLNAKTGFIGSVGRDETGDFFENDLKKAGVETMIFRHDSATGTAVALISADSERTFATHLGAAIELNENDLNASLFRKYDILYLEGYLINDMSFFEKACSMAKGNNMKIAVDLASFNVVNSNLNEFKSIINNYADIVFANEEEARSYTGMEPEEALRLIADQCEIAVVKIGKEGSVIMRNEEFIRIKALPVKSKDTTGAGDLYAAGFLYGYSNDLPLDKCGVIGSLLAGNVIEIVGARINEKRWVDIRRKIRTLISD